MHSKALCLATILAVAFTLSVRAHHSHGNYQMTEYTRLKGTVKEIHWITPHSWIYLEVKDDKGEPALWALEGAGVSQLLKRGWTRDSIKPGDAIAVRCHRLQDGSNGCLLGFVTTADGVEKIFD